MISFRNTNLTFCLLLALLMSNQVMAQWVNINSSVPVEPELVHTTAAGGLERVSLTLHGFKLDPVLTPRGKSFSVSMPGMTPLLEAGMPDLPKFAISLIINDAGISRVRVVSSSYVEYPDLDIAPSKGNLYRNQSPDEVPWQYGAAYNSDEYWPASLTGLRDPYIFRDFRGQTLVLNPFIYNPASRTLRVYTEISVEILQDENVPGKNELMRTSLPDYLNASFASIYRNHFINFPSVNYIPLSESDKMLIICPSNWMSLLMPLVDWKRRRGMDIELVDVVAAGSSASGIQQFIAQRYSSHGISFVLLVGDVAQCPTLSAQGGASDPSYGYVLGADSYPEVMIGRFSAESDEDVVTQVQRVIDYELNAAAGDSSFQSGVVVASEQGPGDDNEMDWEHAVNMRSDLQAFTYGPVAELYDGTHAGTTDAAGDPSSADLFNLFQSGLGIFCYTGHGSTTSCSTTGLSVSDVQNMTNYGKLPFIWAVACVNGEFDASGGPCFAEALLRARQNEQPTGAIATLMSSINQSWDPPMDAQDEMVDILVQSYPSNMKFTFGGLSVNGCMHMNDNYGQAGAEMTDTWHCFGDPSLNVRSAVPQPMTISHPSAIPAGSSSISVNGSFDGALAAISLNGVLLGSGVVSNGQVVLNFQPVITPDTILVTVTGFNQVTYTGMVLVVPASGPYVIQQMVTLSDSSGNNNGQADYGELLDLDVELLNIGPDTAYDVSAQLSTSDQYVTILVDSAWFGDIGSGLTTAVTTAYRIQVSSGVPDQHQVKFDIHASDVNGMSWLSSFSRTVSAPQLAGGALLVNDSTGGDGDGFLESGETATIIIPCHNNGHSDAFNSIAALSSNSPFITIISDTSTLGTIIEQGSADALFTVSMAPNVATGSYYDLQIVLSSGAYSTQKSYAAPAGIILEDFESGGFATFNWISSGNQPWATTVFQPYEGTTCAVSGNINDNQSSELRLSFTALVGDSIAFWFKVSSEAGWDFLTLYIDSLEMDSWSGNIPWSYGSYAVTAGSHQIRFRYEKDGLVSSGSDCSWLDNIRLPVGSQVATGFTETKSPVGIQVWPNPAREVLYVRVENDDTGEMKWRMTDMKGAEVKSGFHNLTDSPNLFPIDLSGIPQGLYLLQTNRNKPVKVVISR